MEYENTRKPQIILDESSLFGVSEMFPDTEQISVYDSTKTINEYHQINGNWDGLYPKKYTLFLPDITMFKNAMPGTTWQHESRTTNHPHPYGQKLRDLAESMMWNHILEEHENFIRIGFGDNLDRNIRKKIDGHSINAITNEEDVRRQHKYNRILNELQYDKSKFTHCYCEAGSENCSGNFCEHSRAFIKNNEGKEVILTAVDSIYYDGIFDFSRQMLLDGKANKMYFTCGVFRNTGLGEVKNIIKGEAKYTTVNAEGKTYVKMAVVGNNSAYTHQVARYSSLDNGYIDKTNLKSSNLIESIWPETYMVTRLLKEIEVDDNYSYCIYERYITKDRPVNVGFYDMTNDNTISVDKDKPIKIKALSTLSLKNENTKTIVDKWLELTLQSNEDVINLLEAETGTIFTYSGSVYIASKLKKDDNAYALIRNSYKVSVDTKIISKLFVLLPTELTNNTINNYMRSVARDYPDMSINEALLMTNIMFEIGALYRISLSGISENSIVRRAWLNEHTIKQDIYDTNAKLQEYHDIEDSIQTKIKQTHKVAEFVEHIGTEVRKLPQKYYDFWRAENHVMESVTSNIDRTITAVKNVPGHIKQVYNMIPNIIDRTMYKFRTSLNNIHMSIISLVSIMCIAGVGCKNPINLTSVVGETHIETVVSLDYLALVNLLLMINNIVNLYISSLTKREGDEGSGVLDGEKLMYGTLKLILKNIIREIISTTLKYTLIVVWFYRNVELFFGLCLACFAYSPAILLVTLVKYTYCMKAGEVIVGTCTPNSIEDMVAELVSRKLIGFNNEGNSKDALIKTSKTREELCKCDRNTATHIMKQKGPLFYGHNIEPKPYFLESCIRNATESTYRQFSSQVKPDENIIREFGIWYHDTYGLELLNHIRYNSEVISFYGWLERYNGKKYDKYFEAYTKYVENNFYLGECVDPCDMRMHSKTDEKVFVDYNSAQPKIKSRTVTEQSDVCKVLMGPLINFISSILKKVDPAYGSGLNMDQMCTKFTSWLNKYTDHVIVCIDGSAFDSTQYAEIMEETDNWLYQKVIDMREGEIAGYCNIKDLRNICANTKQNVRNKYFKYTINGTVPSGKMNTSEGNTRRSALYARFAASKCGLIEDVHYNIETCGDDTIIIMNRDNVSQFITSAYKYVYNQNLIDPKPHGLGQVAKMIDVYKTITEADYISCHFIQNDNGDVKMVRKLDRFLQLTPWTISNPKNDVYKEKELNKQLLRGDALEILSWCGDIQLFQSIAHMLLRMTHGLKAKDENSYREHAGRIDGRDLSFDKAYRTFLFGRYGIDDGAYDKFIKVTTKVKDIYSKMRTTLVDLIYDKSSPLTTEQHLRKNRKNVTYELLGKNKRVKELQYKNCDQNTTYITLNGVVDNLSSIDSISISSISGLCSDTESTNSFTR